MIAIDVLLTRDSEEEIFHNDKIMLLHQTYYLASSWQASQGWNMRMIEETTTPYEVFRPYSQTVLSGV